MYYLKGCVYGVVWVCVSWCDSEIWFFEVEFYVYVVCGCVVYEFWYDEWVYLVFIVFIDCVVVVIECGYIIIWIV